MIPIQQNLQEGLWQRLADMWGAPQEGPTMADLGSGFSANDVQAWRRRQQQQPVDYGVDPVGHVGALAGPTTAGYNPLAHRRRANLMLNEEAIAGGRPDLYTDTWAQRQPVQFPSPISNQPPSTPVPPGYLEGSDDSIRRHFGAETNAASMEGAMGSNPALQAALRRIAERINSGQEQLERPSMAGRSYRPDQAATAPRYQQSVWLR